MSDQIGVGIAGTGAMAGQMAGLIAARPGLRLAAVHSAAPDRARAFAARHGIPAAHHDRAAFLADPAVRLVYIANRSRDHAATALAALKAGRDVLCEKPCALTEAEARAIAEAAAASGRFFMETLWTLFLPATARLIAAAESGEIGAPRHLSFDFGYPVAEATRARLLAPQDGGLLFDRAGYGVAMALRLLGPVAEVSAAQAGGGETVTLALRHEGGGLSRIAVSAGALLSDRLVLGCSHGAAELGPPSLGAERLRLTRAEPVEPGPPAASGLRRHLRQSPALRRLRATLAGPRPRHLPYGASPYAPMLNAVEAALAEGAAGRPEVPAGFSVQVAGVLERARAALETPPEPAS